MVHEPAAVLITDGHVRPATDYEAVPDMDMWLDRDKVSAVRLPADVDLTQLAARLGLLKSIFITFPEFSDGRGFSIARQLRKTYDFKGFLVADGPLIPDQYVYALQCGFDAIRVDGATFQRQSESEWLAAMDMFRLTYQRGYTLKNGPETSIFDARHSSDSGQQKTDPYFGFSAEQALQCAITSYKGKIVLASSLGVDSAVLLHLVAQIDRTLPILFLDTGKHFRETLNYRDMLVRDFGLKNFRTVVPDSETLQAQDPDGILHQEAPDECCHIRKVLPLNAAIEGFTARITGRKRYQTPDRRSMPIYEEGGRQIKINPLAYWQARDISAYMRKHDLPAHPLLTLGFRSIGCQPCTTRVGEDEDARAGRWRHSAKTECGIHYIDGRWQASEVHKTYEVF